MLFMAELDGVRVIVLPPGKGPPGRLKDAIGLMAGLGIAPLAIAKRSADVVPGGRVFPPPTAPKEPMANAPGGLLRVEFCRGPIPPGVLVEPERADPPSPSPMRALIWDSNSKEGFSTKTFWNWSKNSLSYLKLFPLVVTAELRAGLGELMLGGYMEELITVKKRADLSD